MAHRHWVGLVRFAVLLLDDHAAAEDAVQESFGDLLRGWDRLNDKDKALTYLRKAVLNRSRSALRRRRTARLRGRRLNVVASRSASDGVGRRAPGREFLTNPGETAAGRT